jgi:hypothetical protein
VFALVLADTSSPRNRENIPALTGEGEEAIPKERATAIK